MVAQWAGDSPPRDSGGRGEIDRVVQEPLGIRVQARAEHLDRYAFGVNGSRGWVGHTWTLTSTSTRPLTAAHHRHRPGVFAGPHRTLEIGGQVERWPAEDRQTRVVDGVRASSTPAGSPVPPQLQGFGPGQRRGVGPSAPVVRVHSERVGQRFDPAHALPASSVAVGGWTAHGLVRPAVDGPLRVLPASDGPGTATTGPVGSVFRSVPDHWALDQLFPIVPIQMLNKPPTEFATLCDITCDSDGVVDKFVDLARREARARAAQARSGRTLLSGVHAGRRLPGSDGQQSQSLRRAATKPTFTSTKKAT